MATPPPNPYTPDYMVDYPEMPKDFSSNTDFELGWLSGLHKTANKSIDQIYGSYDEFKLNPEDLADLEDLNFDTFVDSPAAIIYISIWFVVGVLFAIVGMCWCCSNRCICCCKSSFKGRKRKDDEDAESTFRPHFSERNDKRYKKSKLSMGAIILTGLMAIWLAGFLVVILYTFAGNKETNKAVGNIQGDLNNGFDDANKYLDTSKNQLAFLFDTGFVRFKGAVGKVVEDCDKGNFRPICEQIEGLIDDPLEKTDEQLKASVKKLRDALDSVQETIGDAQEKVDEDFEDIMVEVNRGLYWFLMLFNVLYCLIFGLVLIGMILAVAGGSNGLKTSGYLAIRGGIVFMFILVFFVVCQLILMFSIGGVTTQIFCPALRELEEDNQGNNQNVFQQTTPGPEYEVPQYGKIMQSCKRDRSAYEAFQLVNAYDVRNLSTIVDSFKNILDGAIPRNLMTNANGSSLIEKSRFQSSPNALDPTQTKDEIINQVDEYIGFIIKTVEEEVGKCLPAYNAINALVSIFCEKIPAPVTAFWYILQFLPPLFLLMILTALFFERIHF